MIALEEQVFINKSNISIKLKGIISLIISSLILVLFLAMPLVVFNDNSIDIKINISGFKYILNSFSGKLNTYNEYYGDLTFYFNTLFSIFAWIIFTTLLVAIVMQIIYFFVLKKDIKWLGYMYFALALITITVFFVFEISSKIEVMDIYGDTNPFYKVYEFGVSLLILTTLCAFNGIICRFIDYKNAEKIKKNLLLYLLLIPATVFIMIFCIYPIFLQTVLSFKNYVIGDGIWKSNWAGFANFKIMFTDELMLKMIKNTVIISLCRMVLGIVPPLILAIFLFDIGMPRYRKILQTIIYIPHFFSWVIIFAIAYAFVNQEGIINNIIVAFGGQRITFFNNDKLLYPLLFISDLWKELGWGTILFLAALSGVDPQLYEAASIDGAGATKKLFHITIPAIAPTIVFVSIMAIGNILKGAGGEQLLLFGTDAMESAQTIDTWVIWKGLQGLQYGLSSAVSFIQSSIGLMLVLTCNHFSKKYTNMGIW